MDRTSSKPLADPFPKIPPELKICPNWVCYTLQKVPREDRPKKIPKDPKTGKNAKADDAATWGTYEQALRHFQKHQGNNMAGIGFELGNTPFCGVDLDNCRNPETGEIASWAQEIIKGLPSYTELSPSGTGVHIIVTGDLPPGGNRRGVEDSPNSHIEAYDQGRFFTMTGNLLDEGTPDWVCYLQEELKAFHRQYLLKPEPPKEPAKPVEPVTLADEELIKKAWGADNGDKFKRLYSGDINGYPSQSEADMALCCMLAFWCGNNSEQVDRLFRISGLMREKWNREDYRAQTIQRAIEQTKEAYRNTPEAENTDYLIFPDIMDGVAGEFARLYGAYLETPEPFLFMSFLTCLGTVLSDRISLNSEVEPQPRLFTLLLGESADERKSTSVHKTIQFFQDTFPDFPVCYGVGSAEGLQSRLQENNKLLFALDELKQFVSKAKIETSVLLPCVNTLFESNRYETRTKTQEIKLENVYLSILAASTISTYEGTWDSSFTDIGFNNRLFLVPGKGEKKHAIPQKIPKEEREKLKKRLSGILPKERIEFDVTAEGMTLFTSWYMGLERSVHAKRLDAYALRFMPLFAVNDGKTKVDKDIIKKVIKLMDWELQVRRLHDPIDADNGIARLEEKIRRILGNGAKTERDLKRYCHIEKTGLWLFQAALNNLRSAREIGFDKEVKKWKLN